MKGEPTKVNLITSRMNSTPWPDAEMPDSIQFPLEQLGETQNVVNHIYHVSVFILITHNTDISYYIS